MKISNFGLRLAVIIATLFSYFFFRSVPVSKIWNNYTVLYVDRTVQEDEVLKILSDYGCSNVISLRKQRIPFVSDFTPVLPGSENAYLQKRLLYFFDATSNYALYYIPQSCDSNAVKALEYLVREKSINAGIDGKQQFPFVVPLISVSVFMIFLVLTKNRIPFAAAGIFPVLTTLSRPFYPIAAASILFLLPCYLGMRIWNRKKALHVIKSSLYIIIPITISLVIYSSCGWQSIIIGALTFTSAYSALKTAYVIEEYRNSKSRFQFVKIFSSPQLPVMYPKTALHTILTLIPLTAVLVSFVMSARFAPAAIAKIDLPIPMEKEIETSDRLPGIEDYYRWSWNARTYPYRNLNDQDSEESDTVIIPRFESTDSGIVKVDTEIMKCDDKFIEKINREIDGLEYDAIEKFLAKQDKDVKVAYGTKTNTRQQKDSFSLMMILSSLLVPIILLSAYKLKSYRKRK